MLEQIIATYGYLALFVGTFLEGETILIIGGMAAAHPEHPLLDLRWAIFFSFLGSLSGDQLYFFIGRYKGAWILAKLPAWRPKIERVVALLERHSNWLLLTFRFFYGLRNVTSLGVGMSRVPIWRFAVLNSLGAMIWALAFGMGGYLFGQVMMSAVGHFKKYQLEALGAVCLAALVIWVLRIWRRRRAAGTAQAGQGMRPCGEMTKDK
jgi:membrane protein DedA with SNARE-associated domain